MIEIVPFSQEHISSLAALEKTCFPDPWSEKTYQELLEHSYYRCLVAVIDGEIAGFAGMTVSFEEGDIDKIMVAPQFRRRGIAQLLLAELFSVGEELGVEEYTLEVRKSNVPAICLYEKNGFRQEGVRPHYYSDPTEDALILWRRTVS